MKTVAAFALAAALAAGSLSTASALDLYAADGTAAYAVEEAPHVGPDGTVYHHCHGMSSGTAHDLCGTASGGPVGGLF